MKEHPIIFSAPEVRAILDGRKTQMRRVVKPQPLHDGGRTPRVHYDADDNIIAIGDSLRRINCPYGPGDRIWVRETWMPFDTKGSAGIGPKVEIGYKATNDIRPDGVSPLDFGASMIFDCTDVEWEKFRDIIEKMDVEGDTWFSPVSMPRWVSRITLGVTRVSVDRLQDISPADCYEEGIESVFPEIQKRGLVGSQLAGPNAYRELWESNNGPGSWAANPWVWVIEFKRI